jgi:outer membrane usher protein
VRRGGTCPYRLEASILAIAAAMAPVAAHAQAEPAAASPGPAPAPTSAPAPAAPASAPAPGTAEPAAVPATTPPATEEVRLNRTGRTMTIVLPLKDGANYLGDVDAQIRPDDTVLVSMARVLELLTPRLDDTRVAALRGLPTTQGFVELGAFAQSGLTLEFDKRALELSIAIPAGDRALRSIALSDSDPGTIGEFATPEPFSAYLNIRGALDYIHKGSLTGLGDPFVQFDGAARVGRVVFEAEGEWDGQASRFRRSGSRLVYDDARHLARLTAGDLLSETRGFQGALDIAGLGISRSYALLDPRRNVAPRGGQTFSLERDATVEAIVNGRTVRVLRLQPGTYNVSDFPFAQGGNDVQLVITDATGQRDVISFTTYIERSQLAAGLSEYSFNIGALTNRVDSVHYSNDIAASGFYRRGINEHLTLGGNFQYSKSSYLVGAEAVFGTPWATIGGDIAFSHIQGAGAGWAANFSIERVTQGENGGSSLIATFETRSRRFGAPGQLFPDNPYRFIASLSYNRAIGRSSFAGAQLRYSAGRGAFDDERSVRLSIGRRIGRFTNVVLDGEWSRGAQGEDKGIRISLVRRFGPRSSARAEYDSDDNRVRLGVQSSGGYGVGAWSGVANVDIGPDTYSVNASGNYVANRADIGLAHTAAYSTQSNSIVDERTSLRVATSIAYAGGSFAIGRPISDSFAIMRRHSSSDDFSIIVDPSQGSYQARSGALGPALYGQVGSYSPRTLTYDVPNAPTGMDIGTGSIRMLAPYRAGYVVTVGSDYNVLVVGRLTFNGDPLALKVGYATEEGGDGRRVEFFTNRQGRFGISPLRPGRWRIEISGDQPIVYELNIPESTSGVVRIGDLNPVEER